MPTGLIRRGGRYSVRRVIPLDLQAHFGRREIVRALGTADPKQARVLHSKMWVQLDEEFEAVRLGLGEQAKQSPVSGGDAGDSRATISSHEAWSEWQLEQMEWQSAEASRVENEREEREARKAYLATQRHDTLSVLQYEKMELEDQLEASQFETVLTNDKLLAARAQATQPPTKAASPPPRKGTSLSFVIDRWAAENKPMDRTVNRTRNIVKRFEAANGNLPVEAINKAHILAFKDREIEQGQTPANVNVMIPMLGTVLNFAADKLHLIERNPAAKIRVTDKRRAKDKRREFDDAALATMFSSPVYSQDKRPVGGAGEAAYWLPLLALFTGARQTELGQLHPSDVYQEAYPDANGIEMTAWVVRFVENNERGQRVKTEGSERRVPIHSSLIELGFLDLVERTKRQKRTRIFDKLKPNSQGELMASWSKWFTRYRRSIGLAGANMPFHSFRHSFKHYARLSGINPEAHNALTGHETGDTSDSYGGLSFPLAPLVVAMTLYRVPGLQLPPRPVEFR